MSFLAALLATVMATVAPPPAPPPRDLQSLASSASLGGAARADGVRAAIGAGDVARVDALATEGWQLQPRIEQGGWAWRVLAGWLDDQGRPELATTWRERARAADDGWLNRVWSAGIARARVATALLDGLFLGAFAAALLAGARTARRRRLAWTDGVSVVAPFVVALFVVVPFSTRALRSIDAATESDAAHGDLTSPRLRADLERAPASAARDRVLAFARGDAGAPAPSQADLAAAIPSVPPATPQPKQALLGPWSLYAWLPHGHKLRFGGLLVVFALAWLAARKVPAIARTVGARGLGPLSGLVAGLAATGVYALVRPLPADPGALHLFGLDTLGAPAYAPAPTLWATLSIGGSLLLSAAAWEWNRRRNA